MARPKLRSASSSSFCRRCAWPLRLCSRACDGLELDGAPDHLEAFGELALLERQHGDVIERVDVARVLLQDRHIALHGKLVLALAVQRERLLDGLLRAFCGRG